MGDVGEYWRDVKNYFEDRNRHPEKYFSKKEIEAYNKRVAKRTKRHEQSKAEIKRIADELGIELKTYPANGQYSFGKLLDWWTTTGTAIERQSREEHHINFHDTNKLEDLLTLLKQR